MRSREKAVARVLLIHALFFLAFWLTNGPYQSTLNAFLMGKTGLRTNFMLVFLLFAGLEAGWSAVRLILRRMGRRTGPVWPFNAAAALFLLFFYASFAVLFRSNPAQLYRLGQLMLYFRIIFDAGILLFLAWLLGRQVRGKPPGRSAWMAAGLLALWLVPVFRTPANVYRGPLPEKPRLFAHRGASTQAPENTLAAMQAAADLGVYGLETDITVSRDGVLFLMHDATLGRTTNIAGVFPDRAGEPAESFTWDELSRLDAGSWYPGWSTPSGDPIPTLDAGLKLAADRGLHFLYDLRIPAEGHPYHDRAFDMVLQAIDAAGIAERAWILAGPDEIDRVWSILPDAVLAAGIGYTSAHPSPESLTAAGFRVVNSVYSLSIGEIEAYRQAGLWVNLWVVDEPWLYSRLWLAGVDSMTSNNVQDLITLPRPAFALPYDLYLLVWGGLGMAAAGVVVWSARYKPAPGKAGVRRRLFPPPQ